MIPFISPVQRSNIHRLYADIFWYGIVAGTTLAFQAVYATRLGANSFQLSLLTAGPAMVNLLFSLPAGRWLEGRGLIPVTFWTAAIQRLGFLALILLPWLFVGRLQIWAVVLLTLLMSVPGTVLAISFNAMFADVTDPDLRADIVGRRNALVAVSMTGSVLISGQILDRVPFPLNYQIVFLIGAIGAAISTYHLWFIQPLQPGGEPPHRVERHIGDAAQPGLMRIGNYLRNAAGWRLLTRSGGKPLLRLDLLRSSFGPFLAAYLLFYTFQYTTIPLFPLQFVRGLHLSDSQISLGSMMFNGVMFLTSLQLGWFSARWSHRQLMIVSGMAYSLYPLLIGLARGPALFWIASLTGGAVWALLSTGMLNRLMERVPEGERPAYMALHNIALNLGILAGSLGGPLMGESIGLSQALLLGAGLRFLAGVLFIYFG